MDSRPIGIFDSGVGGFSVLGQVLKNLPCENLIYLGDTARIPYGTRDNETINSFAQDQVRFLLRKNVKALVVACNSMSAVSLSKIKRIAKDVPVVDVIVPTVSEATAKTNSNTIAVIGTNATITSNVYKKLISEHGKFKVIQTACPLFVSLVEEGFINERATQLVAEKYLSDISKSEADVLILGCTHYPMLKQVIGKILRSNVKIIDSGFPTTKKLKKTLEENKILNNSNIKPKHKFYVTDNPERSLIIANLFFNGNFPWKIEKISI